MLGIKIQITESIGLLHLPYKCIMNDFAIEMIANKLTIEMNYEYFSIWKKKTDY